MTIINVHIKQFLLSCGMLFAILSSYAQERYNHNIYVQDTFSKPMVLQFRINEAVVDSEYMDNAHTLRYLDEIFSNLSLTERIDSIHILSFASPEGRRKYNERLARQRSTVVKDYLIWKYSNLVPSRIHPRPQGENWKELRELIAGDKRLPNRKEVLKIIDRTPDTDRCKVLLKELNGGSTYRYIRDRLLRYLRNASLCIVWMHPDSLSALPTATPLDINGLRDRNDRSTILPRLQGNSVATPCHHPLFALKTNLLFDVAMMPNIELEIPIGRRWSVNAEYMFPWWLFDGDKYSMQILMGGLEGRYWLGSKEKRINSEVLTGHFLGLYAGGGKYDLQWKEDGYQGEFFIAAGISYGWATRIARNLHLEFNIGIGILRTDYRYYHARDNYQTLLWQNNGRYTWFGPTKAKISLVWLLNRKVKIKKGGTR